MFRTRTIGVDPSDGISCPNFEKVANAFKISYMKIEDSNNLLSELNYLFNIKGPVLCEIMGKEDQGYITTHYAKNQKNRLVRRPIEDQAPFIDRDLFLSEMIVDPIDQ